MADALPALLTFITPLGVLLGGMVALSAVFDLSRGYSGAAGRLLSGIGMGATAVALPSLLPVLAPHLGIEMPADEATKDKPSTEVPADEATKDTNADASECESALSQWCYPDSGPAAKDPDAASPLGITAEHLILTLGGILALALTLGVIAATYFGVRHQRRKHAEALAAAEQARIEEEARLDRVWAEAVARHDHLREEMMRHQSDIDLVLSMPLINDQNDPKTAAFTEALARAADLAHDTRPASATAVENYATATRAADRAWGAAWRNADRIRLAQFGPDERATIKQVAKLMHRAENETSAEARNTYYRKAMSMLGDLIEIPRPAAEAIEQRIAGVLANPHATSTSADASGDAARTGTGPILTGLLRKARPKVTATP